MTLGVRWLAHSYLHTHMWSRTSSNLLYSFKGNGDGYVLRVTDLVRVYEERLSAKEIAARGDELDCPFALAKPQQIETFLNAVASELSQKLELDLYGGKGVIATHSSGIEWTWEFRLRCLDSNESALIFGNMTNNLLQVVDKVAGLLESRNAVIYKKDLVIEGLLDAGKRGVQYRAPPFLNEYVPPTKYPNVTRDELLGSYWEEHSDSDATE